MPPATLAELAGKRFLGYLSWQRYRRHVHLPEVLEALARDLAAAPPDHVAVTGDITNIALPAEFERAAGWLEGLGAPERVSVVPGNHDAYVAVPWARSLGLWADYMSDDANGAVTGAADFPYLRRRGEVAILGLSTAVPTAPFRASGRLDRPQLERLGERLRALGREGLCRVVLLHHPPEQPGISPRKALTDAAAFRHVVAECGAELVLHGHDHTYAAGRLRAGDGEALVIGVPSASAARSVGRRPLARYHLYAIERAAGGGWQVSIAARGYDPASGSFAPVPLSAAHNVDEELADRPAAEPVSGVPLAVGAVRSR
jgi:3',5'-cyclic AMP phosphodiesterase CpdA